MSEGAVTVDTPSEGSGTSIPVVSDPGSSVLSSTPAAPAAGEAATTIVSEPAATVPHWSDNFSNVDLRSDPLIKGFDSPEALASEHRNLQSLIGRKGVIRPAEDAPDSHWEKFHNDMGRPTTPGAYKLEGFTRPEGVGWDVDGLEKPMIEEMHRLGMSDAQVSGVLQKYGGITTDVASRGTTDIDAAAEAAVTGLKSEWGSAFDGKVDHATRAANKFVDGGVKALESIKLQDGQSVADHPLIIKLLAKFGEISHEAGLIGEGSNTVQTSTPKEASAKYTQFTHDNQEAILDAMHPMHKSVIAERMRLREMING